MRTGVTEGNVIYPELGQISHWSNYSNAIQEYSAKDLRDNDNIVKMGPKMILRLVKESAQIILDKKDNHDF